MPALDYFVSAILVLIALFLTKKETLSDQVRLALMFLSLFAGTRYFFWRVFHSLNTENVPGLAVSLIVFLAELYGLFSLFLFYVQIIKPSQREPASFNKTEYPTVDIFITIFNEPLEVLYKTVVASLAIDYPEDSRKVYILDDGHRPELRNLAGKLGCEYLSRPYNEHAKAGNINYGLKYSKGQYIMMLDCDHIPVRSFLKKTMGYFDDSKVAFVQTAHYFYNPDIFQRNLSLGNEITNDQDLFFYVIEPGKDGFNASFFAGSNAVFRRTALEEIGGFHTETLTEDLHTSMVLHSKGYKSIYINSPLTAGLAPENFRSYLKQRQRWTRGGVQVFLLDNPLWKKGLTFMQRVNYFASNFYFFHGWPRLIYLTAPLCYLLFGLAPLNANLPVLLNFYLPYYFVSLIVFNAVSNKHRNPFWSDVYETVMCFFISWTALGTFVRPKKTVFQVTPKGIQIKKTELAWSFVLPHIVLSLLLIAGMGVAGYRLWKNEINPNGALISGIWGIYNLMIVITAIVLAREKPQTRSLIRVPRKVNCELIFGDQKLAGLTTDLSEAGLSINIKSDNPPFLPGDVKVRLVHSSPRLNQPAQRLVLPPDATVRLTSELGESTEVKGEVIRYDLLPTGQFSIAVRFLNLSDDQRNGLIKLIYSSPDFWQDLQREFPTIWKSFKLLATSSYRAFVRRKIFRRLSPRISREYQCEFVSEQGTVQGITENISYKGLSVRIKTDAVLQGEVMVQLYRNSLIFRGRGQIVHFSKVKGKEMVYGIRFLEQQDPELAVFLSSK